MCDCDCELTKQERWAIVRREYGEQLARKLRRKSRQLSILRSEEARLTAKGLHMGADMIDQEGQE